jgi:hypothetical protein
MPQITTSRAKLQLLLDSNLKKIGLRAHHALLTPAGGHSDFHQLQHLHLVGMVIGRREKFSTSVEMAVATRGQKGGGSFNSR